jgi:FolB domain-containing protein
MTLFLASVTGPQEAETAIAEGADIVDLKDPAAGVLGAVAPAVVRATVAAVAGRRPLSAVTGDLPMQPERLAAAAGALVQAGVDYVKVGLFADAGREQCIAALAPLAARSKLVGVMFADAGADDALLPLLARSGFAGAMLDTAHKDAGGLLDHRDIAALGSFVDACGAHGLMAGLAGSLEPPDVPRLLLLAPDVLGFRGALCAGRGRAGHIDPEAVAAVRALIPPEPRGKPHPHAGSKIDYRLLAARGYAPGPDGASSDRIFVRDFVLPVRIGAYARERRKPQKVRFNVDVQVQRPGHAVGDMRDVFSYDIVTDGIRMIVAQEHIPFVETLAERVAALVLTHPRALAVTVRVEKLEVVDGAVGVEIVRERAAETAKVHQLFPLAVRERDGPGE